MSAPDFLSNALKSSLPALSGGESIGIGGRLIPAVLDTSDEIEDLLPGGDGDQRVLTALLASVDLESVPVKGDKVTARGQDWTVHQVDHHPLTSTRLTLHGDYRREI